jgi:hypothetical protein
LWAGCLFLAVSSGFAEEDARMAANESAAIAACKTFAEAEEIYRRTDYNNDGVLEYAQHINGGKGQYGLYTNGDDNATPGNLSLVDAAFANAELVVTNKPVEDKDVPEPKAEEQAQYKELAAKLASEDFQEREDAKKKLAAMGSGAIKLLEATAKETTDAEVRNSCKAIADEQRLSLGEKLGYRTVTGKPRAGYLFKIMTAQGANAPGGKRNYIVNGRLANGYAIVAIPAEYGKTGKNTFIINNTGQVYQADLGADSRKIGEAMTEYNPDKNWTVAE